MTTGVKAAAIAAALGAFNSMKLISIVQRKEIK